MSDAPRWPGSDGSTGLDFSRSDKPTPSDDDSSAPADVDGASSGEETRHIPKAEPETSSRPEYSFGSTPSPQSRSQNADDWELDGITRSRSSSLDATIENITAPASVPTPSRAARADDSAPTVGSSAPARPARRTRKARLRLNRIDPWSVMKTSFLFSIAFFVMLVAGIAVLWSVFAGSDTMTYINDFVNRIMADDQGGVQFDIAHYLGWERVIGLTAVLAAINVVIFTAVATLFAFLYNLSAVIMGGLEVTLAED